MPVRPSSAPAFSTSAAGYSVATRVARALSPSRRGVRTGDLGHERGADARAILGGLLDQEPVYRRVEIDRRAADVARDVAFPDQHRDELFGVLTAAGQRIRRIVRSAAENAIRAPPVRADPIAARSS